MHRMFFDTETTGKPKNYKAKIQDVDNWPRVVQLSYIVFDEETELVCEDFIVKPDGFVISDEVAEIHGITQEMALEKGLPLIDVMKKFRADINSCDVLIAHNISFDVNVVGAEFIRLDEDPEGFAIISQLCTMKAGTRLCRLPGKFGYKWPKLSELHLYLFGETFEGAHNALVDIRATARCYFRMKKLGSIR